MAGSGLARARRQEGDPIHARRGQQQDSGSEAVWILASITSVYLLVLVQESLGLRVGVSRPLPAGIGVRQQEDDDDQAEREPLADLEVREAFGSEEFQDELHADPRDDDEG